MRHFKTFLLLGTVLGCAESDSPTAPAAGDRNTTPADHVQSAAPAPKPPAVQYVSNARSITSPTLGYYLVSVTCPTGTLVVGGGVSFKNAGQTSSFNHVVIAGFGPTSTNGFFGWYRLTQATSHVAIATAACLKA